MDMGSLGCCSVYILWELMPCSLTGRFQHFGSTQCLCLQGIRSGLPLRMGAIGFSKRWYLYTGLHSVTSLKIILL